VTAIRIPNIAASVQVFCAMADALKGSRIGPSLLTRFWLRSNASVTKLSKLYVVNF
jgi:hypothetical protein